MTDKIQLSHDQKQWNQIGYIIHFDFMIIIVEYRRAGAQE